MTDTKCHLQILPPKMFSSQVSKYVFLCLQRGDFVDEIPTRDPDMYYSPERLSMNSMNSLKGGNSMLSLFPDDDSGFK